MQNYLKDLNATMKYENTALEMKESDFCENQDQREHLKLLLNSALGKFNQKEKKINSRFIRTTRELQTMLEEQDIIDLNDISDNICQVNYRTNFSSKNRKTNPTILAFITANARISLHQKIIQLVKKNFTPFYCDTDSILYAGPKNVKSPLKISLAFGDFKHELGEEAIIQKFEAFGRKNFSVTYAKRNSSNVQTIMKVCGISLDSKIAQDQLRDAYIRKEKQPKITQIRLLRQKNISLPLPSLQYVTLNNVDVRCERKLGKDKSTLPWGF